VPGQKWILRITKLEAAFLFLNAAEWKNMLGLMQGTAQY
jgi:hypothetical protein